MINLYYWTTPNGHKITIFLEESGLPYNLIPINITQNEQFAPEFLRISPNNKIPAIVDHAPDDGGKSISIFESGAILIYLADKTKKFLSQDLRTRFKTLEWLFWQVSGLGPMAGQANYFVNMASEKVPYAMDRYIKETERLFSVLEKQLNEKEFITGEYSIADIASYPWVAVYEKLQLDLKKFPNVKRWYDNIHDRPAVKRAYAKADEVRAGIAPSSDPSCAIPLRNQPK